MEFIKAGYVIRENGSVIAEVENLLTTSGKRIMASFMAGLTGRWAGAIAVGAIGTSVGVAGTRLGFEWGRTEITSSAVSYGLGASGAHRLIFKGTLDQSFAGKVYEIGIFPQTANIAAGVGQSQAISFGGSADTWQEYIASTWTTITPTFDTTNNRVGQDMALLTVPAAGTKYYRIGGIALDLSMYSTTDLINFSFLNATTNPSSLSVIMGTDDTNYFTASVTPATWLGATGTYKTATLTKGDFGATGFPDWGNITSVEFDIVAPGGGVVDLYLDGIRMEDVDTFNPDYALVSHAVPGSPVTKTLGTVMDIEYYLDVPS
jgi:hypothetical protein